MIQALERIAANYVNIWPLPFPVSFTFGRVVIRLALCSPLLSKLHARKLAFTMADATLVKGEPEEGSPMPLDDDIYEDAGDLEFFDPSSHEATLYLARVPHYVWQAWDKLDDDEEIQIGTVRQWTETDKAGNPKVRCSLLVHGRTLVDVVP